MPSSIEWTDETLNPFVGCSKVSPGCQNCYAIFEAIRKVDTLQLYAGVAASRQNSADGKKHPNWTGVVNFNEEVLREPYGWRTPRRVFVASMSDMFFEHVPFEWVEKTFKMFVECRQHIFQVLTKRSEIMATLAPHLPWPDNLWMGISAENADYTFRIDDLRKVPAKVRFLSLEPLLGPLDNLDLTGIHWVIVGGESGPGHRPMNPDWVRSIRDQCLAAGVAFFFKQWGGSNQEKKKNGRELDGREWKQFPDDPKPAQLMLTGPAPTPEPEPNKEPKN